MFVAALNRAFSADQITGTLRHLGPHVSAMDALEIVARLGLLTWVPADGFFKYRDTVGIPPLHMHILTLAFQSALLHPQGPNPLVIDIVEGPVEAVAVSQPQGHFAVTLTRTTLDPFVGST